MADERTLKTDEQLMALLREAVEHEPVPLTGFQWIKIVPADPATHGANWAVAHSGEAGGHFTAIERAYARLKDEYDLVATS